VDVTWTHRPIGNRVRTNNLQYDSESLRWNQDFDIIISISISVHGRSLTGIVGSNPAYDMDVCLLCVLCVVR
jgi:hypothetical protein